MAPLLTSGGIKGGCPVCGSPDRSCGETHETGPVLDIPSGPGGRSNAATILATARVNGIETTFKTTPEEAAANGWKPVGDPEHKARPAPSSPKPVAPEPTGPVSGGNEPNLRDLRAQAKAAGIPNYRKLNRTRLIEALEAHRSA